MEQQYSLVVLYVLIMSYIKVYFSDTEAVEACIRFIDDDDDVSPPPGRLVTPPRLPRSISPVKSGCYTVGACLSAALASDSL